MRTFLKPILFLACVVVLSTSCAFSEPDCTPNTGVVLQILGSGGPIADDGRASSGYVIWVNGVSRVLVDAGGGTFLRFGEAAVNFVGLDFIGLSHFHTDHSADFPALLKSGSFSGRKRALHVAGPSAGGPFPGLDVWLQRELDAEAGAYAYLSNFLDGTNEKPMLVTKEINGGAPVTAFKNAEIVVEAMQVPHGIVPAVAFKVTVDGETLVFASDQNGGNPAFSEFAKDASILVMHLVVPEDVTGVGRRLHAPPSVIGNIAKASGAKKLVLSHFMARSLRDVDSSVQRIRSSYSGDVVLAEDLMCLVP